MGTSQEKIKNNSDQVSEVKINHIILETDFFASKLVELYKPRLWVYQNSSPRGLERRSRSEVTIREHNQFTPDNLIYGVFY